MYSCGQRTGNLITRLNSIFELRDSSLLSFVYLRGECLAGGLLYFDLACRLWEGCCCSAPIEYTTGGSMSSGGTIFLWRRCYWFCWKVYQHTFRSRSYCLAWVREIDAGMGIEILALGLPFHCDNDLWRNRFTMDLPFHLGNYEVFSMEFGFFRFTWHFS